LKISHKIDEVGRGLAVAFVATIDAVGAANLFCLRTQKSEICNLKSAIQNLQSKI